MKFCSKCSNMYYITANAENRDKLSYYCRICKHVDDAVVTNTSVCVLNTQVNKNQIHIEHFVNKYTKLDPTLPRIYNLPCPDDACISNGDDNSNNHREVLYMRYNDTDMKYLYMCCRCDRIWLP